MQGFYFIYFSLDIENHVVCSSSEQMRFWENVDLPGNDLLYTTVLTVEHCMDICIRNEACNAFTYDTKNRITHLNCWSKTEPSAYNPNSDGEGYISGVRCSVPSIEEPLSQPHQYPEGLFIMARSVPFLFKVA